MADFIRDTKDNQRLVGVVLEEGETSIEIPADISIVAPRVFTRDVTIEELSTVASCRFSEGSFYGNSTIRSLNLSADTVVDSAMFAYGNTVEEIVLGDGSPYLYQGGVLLEGEAVVLGTSQEEIEIPEGVTRISPYAFSGCYGIHSVKFPSTLEEIGEYAFCDCDGIEELSIPRKVSSVGIGAFFGCSKVHLTIIGSGETEGITTDLKILAQQFGSNVLLNTIKIPGYVTGINDEYGSDAFHGVYNIEKCIVDGVYEARPGWRIIAKSYPNGTEPRTLTFNPEGGICDELSREIYTGTPFGSLPTPYGKTGYSFEGWYLGDEQITPETMFWGETDITLTARWVANVYTIVFWRDNGTVYEEVSAPYGEEVHVPATPPPHSGSPGDYTFEGWKDESGNLITADVVLVEGNANYYPKYKAEYIWKVYLNGTTAIIVGIDENVDADELDNPVVIPSKVTRYGNEYDVVGFGYEAFSHKIAADTWEGDERLDGKAIVIPVGIQSISSNCFRRTGITALTLATTGSPAATTVTEIGGYAFEGCTKLVNINRSEDSSSEFQWNIPYGVTTIGEAAFLNTGEEVVEGRSLHLALPETIASMGSYCFKNSAIYAVEFDNRAPLTAIPYEGFDRAGIRYLDQLPDNITRIEDAAFRNNPLFDMPSGFYYLPALLERIGREAFRGCAGLRRVVRRGELDEQATLEVLYGAFQGCFAQEETNESSMYLGKVGTLGPDALNGCQLNSLSVSAARYEDYSCFGLSAMSNTPGIDTSSTVHVGIGALSGMPTWAYQRSYSSPTEYVPAIRGFDLYYNWLVTSHKSALKTESHIDIRQWDDGTQTELAGIAGGVFDGSSLTALSVVYVPGGVRWSPYVVEDVRVCSKSFINFPVNILTVYFNGKVSVETAAFSDITTLNLHLVGDSPGVFEAGAFHNVLNLNIYVDTMEVWEHCQFEGDVNEDNGYTLYVNGSKVTSLILTKPVENEMYMGMQDIQSVLVQEGCDYIGARAFKGCTGLRKITFSPRSSGGLDISEEAFMGCTALDNPVAIVAGVHVGVRAFYGCSSLASVTFPDFDYRNPPDVSYDAFDECHEDLYTEMTSQAGTLVGDRMIIRLAVTNGIKVAVLYQQNSETPSELPRHFFARNVFSRSAAGNFLYISGDTAHYYPWFDLSEVLNFPQLPRTILRGFSECYVDWNRVGPTSTLTELELQAVYNLSEINYAFIQKLSTVNGGPQAWQSYYDLCVKVTSLELWCAIEFGEYDNPLRHKHKLIWTKYRQDYEEEVEKYLELVETPHYFTDHVFNRINNRAFDGCTSFTSVTIGDNILTMGVDVFRNCNEAIFDRTSKPGLVLVDGWIVGYDVQSEPQVESGYIIYDLTGVRGVCDYAFTQASATVKCVNVPSGIRASLAACENTVGLLEWCDAEHTIGLIGGVIRYAPADATEITIPDTINCTGIGENLFDGNTVLEKITIAKGQVNVYDQAFRGCSSLVEFNAVDGIGYVGISSFENCTSLAKIEKLSGTLKNSAFKGCSSLASVEIRELKQTWTAITNNGCFQDCSSIKSIVVPGISWAVVNNYLQLEELDVALVFGAQVDTITATVDTTYPICEMDLHRLTEVKSVVLEDDGSGFKGVFFAGTEYDNWRGENADASWLASCQRHNSEGLTWYQIGSWLWFVEVDSSISEVNLSNATFKGIMTYAFMGWAPYAERIILPVTVESLSANSFDIGGSPALTIEFMGDAPDSEVNYVPAYIGYTIFEPSYTRLIVQRGTVGWGNVREPNQDNLYTVDSIYVDNAQYSWYDRDSDSDDLTARNPYAWCMTSSGSIVYSKTDGQNGMPAIGSFAYTDKNDDVNNIKTITWILDTGPYWHGAPIYFNSHISTP